MRRLETSNRETTLYGCETIRMLFKTIRVSRSNPKSPEKSLIQNEIRIHTQRVKGVYFPTTLTRSKGFREGHKGGPKSVKNIQLYHYETRLLDTQQTEPLKNSLRV